MSNIEQYKSKKPELIRLKEDYQRISSCSSQEISTTIAYLNILLGAAKPMSEDEIMVYIDYLKKSFSNFTLEEVKKAFIMAVNGQFTNVKLYNKLDSFQTGVVMASYKEYFSNSSEIKNYLLQDKNKVEELTWEQKDAIGRNSTQKVYEYYLAGPSNFNINLLWASYQRIVKKQGITFSEETIEKIKSYAKNEHSKAKENARMKDMFTDLHKHLEKLDFDEKKVKMSYATLLIFERASQEGIKDLFNEEIIETEI